MTETNAAAVLPNKSEFSAYVQTDPIRILDEVESAISSFNGGGEEPSDSLSGGFEGEEESGVFFSSIATTEVVRLLAIPEPGAPKKRGRRPKPRPEGEFLQRKMRAADALWSGESGARRRRNIDPSTCERDYSEDEIEFMRALDIYKKLNGRLFPTCSETLEVIRRLGYVKMPPVREDISDGQVLAAPAPCFEVSEGEEIAGACWSPLDVTSFTA